jgi:outer membrane protein/S-layer protein transport system outer membrane protein
MVKAAVGLSLAALTSLAPASTLAETLQDAVREAYESNPTLGEQRMRQRIYDEGYAQAESGLQPSASISAQRDHSNQRPPILDQTMESASATLTLQQPLYTGGQTAAAVKAAGAQILAGRENLSAVEGQLILNVVSVYVGVTRDQAKLKVAQDNLAALQSEYAESQARRKVRQGTITDVAQAEGRMRGAEAQVENAKAALAITRSQYLQLVGSSPDNLEPPPDLAGLPDDIDQAFEAGERINPTLNQAKFTEQSSRAKIEQAKGVYRPTLTADLSVGYTATANYVPPQDVSPTLLSHNDETNVTASLVLRVPIFQASLDSQVRQAIAQNGSDQLSVEDARRTVLQSIVQAWSQLYAARTTLSAYNKQVSAFVLAYEGMRKEEPFGLRDRTEVLNAEQELASAQLALLDARYNEYVSRASLLNAIGGLSAQSIDPTVKPYRPEEYFRKIKGRGILPWGAPLAGLESIGAPSPTRPVAADLTGAGALRANLVPPLPPPPSAAELDSPMPSIDAEARMRVPGEVTPKFKTPSVP